jgi:hypothetical protein
MATAARSSTRPGVDEGHDTGSPGARNPARTPPDVAVDARSLARRSRAELDALFVSLATPALPDLAGDLRGVQVDLAGLERLPRAVRSAFLAALRGPLGLWRGKRLAGARGTNLWGIGPVRRTFAQFRVAPAAALDGSGPCLQLDYDVPENPLPLRGILGECRTLGPGLFLGRMHYRVGSGRTCLLYFTLEA